MSVNYSKDIIYINVLAAEEKQHILQPQFKMYLVYPDLSSADELLQRTCAICFR